MSLHKCNRENCPPANINGPSMKCAKCNNLSYLKCFGIDKDDVVDNALKAILVNDGLLRFEVAKCQFICCSGQSAPNEPKSTPKQKGRPPNRDQSASRQTQIKDFIENNTILTELTNIKKVLSDLTTSSDQNLTELSSLKSTSIETNTMVKKLTEANQTVQVMDTMRLSTPIRSSTSIKRKLEQTQTPNQTPKINPNVLPKPREGTRDINIGPPTDFRRAETIAKPVLDKSVWVSGLDPSVSNETMIDFIVNNTNITNKDDFKCHKLVKKDSDVTKLSYVSFKIDVKEELFNYLVDPNIWPKHVSVREFIKIQPVKLSDFIAGNQNQAGKQRKLDEQKNSTEQPNETMQGMEQI